jgi:hypothetical protein
VPATPPKFRAVYQQDRPAWMHEGTLEAALLEGHEALKVVGESYRQGNLWRVVGGRNRPEVHVRIHAGSLLGGGHGDHGGDPAAPTGHKRDLVTPRGRVDHVGQGGPDSPVAGAC